MKEEKKCPDCGGIVEAIKSKEVPFYDGKHTFYVETIYVDCCTECGWRSEVYEE